MGCNLINIIFPRSQGKLYESCTIFPSKNNITYINRNPYMRGSFSHCITHIFTHEHNRFQILLPLYIQFRFLSAFLSWLVCSMTKIFCWSVNMLIKNFYFSDLSGCISCLNSFFWWKANSQGDVKYFMDARASF